VGVLLIVTGRRVARGWTKVVPPQDCSFSVDVPHFTYPGGWGVEGLRVANPGSQSGPIPIGRRPGFSRPARAGVVERDEHLSEAFAAFAKTTAAVVAAVAAVTAGATNLDTVLAAAVDVVVIVIVTIVVVTIVAVNLVSVTAVAVTLAVVAISVAVVTISVAVVAIVVAISVAVVAIFVAISVAVVAIFVAVGAIFGAVAVGAIFGAVAVVFTLDAILTTFAAVGVIFVAVDVFTFVLEHSGELLPKKHLCMPFPLLVVEHFEGRVVAALVAHPAPEKEEGGNVDEYQQDVRHDQRHTACSEGGVLRRTSYFERVDGISKHGRVD